MTKTIVGTLGNAVDAAARQARESGDPALLDAVEQRIKNAQAHNDELSRTCAGTADEAEVRERDKALADLRERVSAERAGVDCDVLNRSVPLASRSTRPSRL